MSDFEAFLDGKRREAASAYARVDASKVLALSTTIGTATFFDPGGRVTSGATAVNAANERGAAHFGANGTTELDVLDSGAEGDLAFWTGYQIADVEIDGKAMHMKLRITEVFRRAGDEWKMVHRHASKAAD